MGEEAERQIVRLAVIPKGSYVFMDDLAGYIGRTVQGLKVSLETHKPQALIRVAKGAYLVDVDALRGESPNQEQGPQTE